MPEWSMASKPPPSGSSLNPNAAVFVPAALQAAEDFSPEWWQLIQTNSSYREWWMKERHDGDEGEQQQPQQQQRNNNASVRKEDPDFDDIDDLLELGFQSGILDDLEDNPSPVGAHRLQQQIPNAYQPRPSYYQPQQRPQPQLRLPQQLQQQQHGQPQQNGVVKQEKPL